MEVVANIMRHCVSIQFEKLDNLFRYVDWVERDYLEDHGEEDLSIGWNDYVDQRQMHDYLQILDRTEHLI